MIEPILSWLKSQIERRKQAKIDFEINRAKRIAKEYISLIRSCHTQEDLSIIRHKFKREEAFGLSPDVFYVMRDPDSWEEVSREFANKVAELRSIGKNL